MTKWEIKRKEADLKRYLKWRLEGIRSDRGVTYGDPYLQKDFEFSWHHATKGLAERGYRALADGRLERI